MHVDLGASFPAKLLYLESLFAIALYVAYTVAFRYGIAALTASVIKASTLACPDRPHSAPAARRVEADKPATQSMLWG